MTIAIRVDASAAMGLGHVRRCLSLAQALRDLGRRVLIVARESDVDIASLARAEGMRASIIPALSEPLEDAAAFCDAWRAAFDEAPAIHAWAVVDHYELDATWHQAVRDRLRCRIAAIDDLANRPLSVDALIDHNFVPPPGHRARYAPVLAMEPALWLTGPRFALLGPAYARVQPRQPRDVVRSIGVFLGGTDPAGLTPTVLRACREPGGFQGPIEVVTTSACPSLAEIRAACAADGNATLSMDLPDLAEFHVRHDLHVGAGGGAAWERCYAAQPALTLCVAANQRAVIDPLSAIGALATVEVNDQQHIGAALARLIGSAERRKALSELSSRLVDGQGAQRVALALGAVDPIGLAMRPALSADASAMWAWRNHESTRRASRNADEISLDSHRAWVERVLADPARALLVGHIGPRDFGVLRFDRLDMSGADTPRTAWEVSLYLDPALHGLGLGRALLAAGERWLAATHGIATVHAEVLATNPASRKLFLSAGYIATGPHTFEKPVEASPHAAPASHIGET